MLDPSTEEPAGEENVVNNANNPLADLVAVQLHNYYTPKLYGVPDESANTFWLRILAPYKRLIPRLSLPVETSPSVTPDSKSGLGDLPDFCRATPRAALPRRGPRSAPSASARSPHR